MVPRLLGHYPLSMVPLHFCYQFYACLFVLTLFGGVSILALALMTLYEVGGVELVFALCLACFYGLLKLLLPPWPMAHLMTHSEFRQHQQQQFSYDGSDDNIMKHKRLAIDTYTIKTDADKVLNSNGTSSCCPICLHTFSAGDVVTEGRACGHVFHQDCLAIWLGKSSSCPYCRDDLELHDSDMTKEGAHKNGVWGIFDGVFDSIYT